MIIDLQAVLLAASPVAALVGTRVYPNVRPQGTELPALVLTVISGGREYHFGGVSALATRRVQADAYGATAAGAMALSDAVEAALSGLRAVQGGTEFQGVFLEAERGRFEPAQEEGSRAHRVSLDFIVKYRSA
ncbi:MAG: DUF3168 domain-containing protein [Pseudomonadota bacterium]|nr:DUF3168 domain-containing protein [Pseudomonadota bacterium]MEE3098750.1 DUF3168 domain-containing protein [Pseudomonadota bacterium]